MQRMPPGRQEICEVALRPVLDGGRWFWPLAALLTVPVLIALFAWSTQLTHGLQVTGLSNQIFWGFYISNNITFIGFGYGGALVSAVLHLSGAGWRAPITRLAEAMALVTLCLGAAFIFFDIGRPERAWEFLTTPNGSSPLIWDAIAINTYMLATIVFLYLPLIPDLAIAADVADSVLGRWRLRIYRMLSVRWKGLPPQRKVLDWGVTTIAILIIPIAVTVHSVLSWAFAVTTREGWHSTVMAPYFVVGALYSGVAMVILVVLGFRSAYRLHDFIGERQIRNLGYIMITLGLTYVYITFAELLTEGYPMVEGAVHLLEYTVLHQLGPLFWGFVVCGGLLPTLLVSLPWTRNAWGIGLAALLVDISMWVKRLVIVVPAQAIPLIAGDFGSYSPSWVEVAITLGMLSAIPLLLMLFFRVFPILSIAEIEHVAAHESQHG